MDQKWSHAKFLGKYFDVYGQARPITPEAGKKKAPFWSRFLWLWRHILQLILVRTQDLFTTFLSFFKEIYLSTVSLIIPIEAKAFLDFSICEI